MDSNRNFFICIAILLCAIVFCIWIGNWAHEDIQKIEKQNQINSRIKVVERNDSGLYLYIVEVDGKEYLVNFHGGIVPLK